MDFYIIEIVLVGMNQHNDTKCVLASLLERELVIYINKIQFPPFLMNNK